MFYGKKWDYMRRKIESPTKKLERKKLYIEAIATLREDHAKRTSETQELIDFLEGMAKKEYD